MTPVLSVVVPTFDHADLLPDVVARVLDQELEDLELVVVDDGSTDATPAVLASLAETRLRVVRRPNGGISAARNSGWRAATAPLVVFLDDDDRPAGDWARTLVEAADGAAVVCCGARFVDEEGTVTAVRLPAPLGPAFAEVIGLFQGGTFAVRRDVLEALGGFAEGLQCSHATELALRLTAWCAERDEDVAVVERPLVDIVRRPADRRPEASAAKLLSGTRQLLADHGDALARDPATLADYHGVAGVAAARLGDPTTARHHLMRALRVAPSPRRAARVVAVAVGPARRRLWPPAPPSDRTS